MRGYRVVGRLQRRAMVPAVLSALLLAAACGGGSSSGGSPTAASSPVPQGTGVVVIQGSPGAIPTSTPVPAAGLTAIAAATSGGAIPMVDFTDPGGRFTVKIPAGWTVQTEKDAMSVLLPSTDPRYAASAIAGIFCATRGSIDSLLSLDADTLRKIGEGTISTANERPGTVAGQPARIIPWQGANEGVTHQHVYVYFQGNGCTWRMLLTTFPNVDAAALQAKVLDVMMQSFAFK